MVEETRKLGCTRLCIAFREGPYDWEALEAFATEIVRAMRPKSTGRGVSASLD